MPLHPPWAHLEPQLRSRVQAVPCAFRLTYPRFLLLRALIGSVSANLDAEALNQLSTTCAFEEVGERMVSELSIVGIVLRTALERRGKCVIPWNPLSATHPPELP